MSTNLNIPELFNSTLNLGESGLPDLLDVGDVIKVTKYNTAGAQESTDAFNQIATRPRHNEYQRALRAEIHDPLFMLARQFQMGEFQFEDTGSALVAKLALQKSRLSRFKGFNGNVEYFSNQMPLETKIERQIPKISLKERVRMGEEWLRIVKEVGATVIGFDFAAFKAHCLADYTFAQPATTSDYLLNAKREVSTKENQYIKLISSRKVDGLLIKEELETNSTAFSGFMSPLFLAAVKNPFLMWIKSLYSVPSSNEDCWDGESLSYHAEVSAPQEDLSQNSLDNKVLKIKDYSTDKLDWHAFDSRDTITSPSDDMVDAMTLLDENETAVVESDFPEVEIIEIIPSAGEFPGMPVTRWWELEEGNVNFAGSNLSASDTVKSLMAEFALVYQDDWFIIPKDLPVGSLSKLTGIVVKDTFGQYTYVKHTSDSLDVSNDWSSWNLYGQTDSSDLTEGIAATDDSFFLAPSTDHIMTSEALEEVVFIRDEMANMVFGIEKRVLSDLGESVDATDVASRVKEHLLKQSPETLKPTPDAELRYELGNSVPMNWIPFVPVHQGTGTNRQIKLQRASMPYLLSDFEPIPIRPQTSFLRKGINDDNSITSIADGGNPMYYIQEEIIPRAGIKLEKKMQRTRWFDGKTYLWVSNTKKIGRGQGNSNLQFDRALDSKDSNLS